MNEMHKGLAKWLSKDVVGVDEWIKPCELLSDDAGIRSVCIKFAVDYESGKIKEGEFLAALSNLTGKTLDEINDVLVIVGDSLKREPVPVTKKDGDNIDPEQIPVTVSQPEETVSHLKWYTEPGGAIQADAMGNIPGKQQVIEVYRDVETGVWYWIVSDRQRNYSRHGECKSKDDCTYRAAMIWYTQDKGIPLELGITKPATKPVAYHYTEPTQISSGSDAADMTPEYMKHYIGEYIPYSITLNSKSPIPSKIRYSVGNDILLITDVFTNMPGIIETNPSDVVSALIYITKQAGNRRIITTALTDQGWSMLTGLRDRGRIQISSLPIELIQKARSEQVYKDSQLHDPVEVNVIKLPESK